ncbi:diguanylate cyclase [Pseudoduganella sp. GCM10020061]|uniref:ligand-binding sensor domain-containing diguanylate cyclase n=1 Tax=Pseudoduganella sp. GCM10020061 TaxID=3317345 RepID=UPI0036258305
MQPPLRAPSSPARAFWRAVASLLLVFTCLSASAAAPSQLRFQRLGGVGMADLSILSLVQDRLGFTWIGTASGLYRYDGYEAVRYGNQPKNPRSLPHDRVTDILEDRQGRIWVGTNEGLARFDPHTDDFTRFAPKNPAHTQLIVKQILSDGADGLWIATWGGVQHVDTLTGQFTVHAHDPSDPHSLASNDVNALVRDEVGGLWAATWPGGLDYLPPGSSKFRHYRIDTAERPDSKLNIARALHIDGDKNLWIGTEKGVVFLKAGAPWGERVGLVTPPSRINRFFSDSSGSVWAGTLTAGLLRWERGSDTAQRYRHRAYDPYSLPADDVRAIMQDRGGMLWVGTYTDGIGLVNRNSTGFRRFVAHDAQHGRDLPGSALQAIAGAPDGRLWLATNRGFSLFNPASGEVERIYQARAGQPGALSNDIVYSLYQQPGGPLWVGTSAGLNRLDPATGQFSVMRFDHIMAGFINTIAPSADGTLWLGTGAQVIRFNPASGAWKTYPSQAGVPGTRAVTGTTVIVEDRRGRVWMGSGWNGGGLDMLDPATGKFRNFRHVPGDVSSLSHDNVFALHEDAQGRMWVSTAKGLHEIVSGPSGAIRFRSYPIDTGADALTPHSILHDESGKLWIGTVPGLIRLDPESGRYDRYTATDGLTAGFGLGAAWRAADGILYFGGTKGLTGVEPARVRAVSVAPQVAITDISVLNQSLTTRRGGSVLEGSVNAPRSLTLTAQDLVFSVEFSALHYTNPLANTYAYRLVGFDSDWVYTGAEHRLATYTNLNPGRYRFEVKAANDRGVWSARAASFDVVILPPFWATWWFRAVAGFGTFALLASVYGLRVRSLKRQQARLRDLVAERTRELELTNAKLEELTTTDALTGVTNRRGFDHALQREWRRATRTSGKVALAMLDVDHFKSYNDRYGHQAGDQALKAVAAVISAHARRTTDLVARYGGEEFALLAPSANLVQVMKMANDICAALRELALPHGGSPEGIITVSVGVAAMVPSPDDKPEALVERADRALYRAKLGGRNRAVCEQDARSTTTPA